MKIAPPLRALLVVVLQTIVFIGTWNLMVVTARSLGRFPPELFFDLTICYGAVGILSLFAACALANLLTRRPSVRWCSIMAGLIAWFIWLLPSFESRPVSLPSFFILGAAILTVGTGWMLPYWERQERRKREETTAIKEQDAA